MLLNEICGEIVESETAKVITNCKCYKINGSNIHKNKMFLFYQSNCLIMQWFEVGYIESRCLK